MKKVTKSTKTESKAAKVGAMLAMPKVSDHLTSMVGHEVYISCTSYAYSGTLLGVTAETIEIDCPSIVYETGPWNSPTWKDAQSLPTNTVVIFKSQIEGIFAVTR